MVAKGPFHPAFTGLAITFEHYLRVGWNFHINGFAFNQLDCRVSQETRKEHFIDTFRQGGGRRIHNGRVGTDCNS